MKIIYTFLKGKLEGLGWGTFFTVVIAERVALVEAFNANSEASLSVILVAGASLAGAIWGKIRRGSTVYQSAKK